MGHGCAKPSWPGRRLACGGRPGARGVRCAKPSWPGRRQHARGAAVGVGPEPCQARTLTSRLHALRPLPLAPWPRQIPSCAPPRRRRCPATVLGGTGDDAESSCAPPRRRRRRRSARAWPVMPRRHAGARRGIRPNAPGSCAPARILWTRRMHARSKLLIRWVI